MITREEKKKIEDELKEIKKKIEELDLTEILGLLSEVTEKIENIESMLEEELIYQENADDEDDEDTS